MANSVHLECRSALADFIRTLAFPGLPLANIYERLTLDDSNVSYPNVILAISGIPEDGPTWFSTTHLRTKWPVLILAQKRGDPKDPREAEPYLELRDLLINQLASWLPPVSGALRCTVETAASITGRMRGRTEPGQTTDPMGPAWLKVAGTLVAWVDVVRPRITP